MESKGGKLQLLTGMENATYHSLCLLRRMLGLPLAVDDWLLDKLSNTGECQAVTQPDRSLTPTPTVPVLQTRSVPPVDQSPATVGQECSAEESSSRLTGGESGRAGRNSARCHFTSLPQCEDQRYLAEATLTYGIVSVRVMVCRVCLEMASNPSPSRSPGLIRLSGIPPHPGNHSSRDCGESSAVDRTGKSLADPSTWRDLGGEG